MTGSLSGLMFLASVLIISLMLFGLIVGTVCVFHAQNNLDPVPAGKSAYVNSRTTYWVYASISFAIAIVMLLVLLYLGYAWSCACSKPACPPKKMKACAPKSCY